MCWYPSGIPRSLNRKHTWWVVSGRKVIKSQNISGSCKHFFFQVNFCCYFNLWVQTEGNVILLAIPIYCARDYEWQHWTVLNGFSWVVGLWPQNWIWILFALFCILSIDSIILISIFNHSFVGSSLTLILFFFTLGFPLSPYNLFLIFFTKYIHKHFGKFWISDKDWSLHVYAVDIFFFLCLNFTSIHRLPRRCFWMSRNAPPNSAIRCDLRSIVQNWNWECCVTSKKRLWGRL